MLNSSTKYAIKALQSLSQYRSAKFVSIADLASTSSVPRPYLAKVMKKLAQKKIVLSKKGANGGVKLAKRNKFSFFDVCVALEDQIVQQHCLLSGKKCSKKTKCNHHSQWSKIRSDMLNFLYKTKI